MKEKENEILYRQGRIKVEGTKEVRRRKVKRRSWKEEWNKIGSWEVK